MNRSRFLRLLMTAVLFTLCHEGSAATRTWNGAVSSDWFTEANWDGGVPTNSTDDVVIDGAYTHAPVLDLTAGGITNRSLTLGLTGTSLLTVVRGDLDTRVWTLLQDVTVGTNGTLTHAQNTTEDLHRLHLKIGGDMMVTTGGVINVTGMGRTSGGQGASGTHYGASHGGQGGYANVGSLGPVYGSVTEPTDLGSNGGKGGGVVILNVTGDLVLDGEIQADGVYTTATGGSGGSVWIRAKTLNGQGSITADGGDGTGSYRSGGGGGRIAIDLSNGETTGDVTLTAYGGSGSSWGAAGTVFLKTPTSTLGTLIVDNNGHVPNYNGNRAETQIPAGESWQFDSIVLRNRGFLQAQADTTLTLADNEDIQSQDNGNFVTLRPQSTLNAPAAFGISNVTFRVIQGTNCTINAMSESLTVETNGIVVVDNDWILDSDVTVKAGGKITHTPNADTPVYRAVLTVNGDLAVEQGGRIDVNGCGFNYSATALGTGSSNCGGSHGGRAGQANVGTIKTTYGSITNPVTLGSRGGHTQGGGSIQLTVSGELLLDGSIAADGGEGGASGAGGSILLKVGKLSGSGEITADGGPVTYAYNTYMGSGGGGRVAVYNAGGTNMGQVVAHARGGHPKGVYAPYGAAGTVYICYSNQVHGTLHVNNDGRLRRESDLDSAMTLVSEHVTDTVVGHVRILDEAKLELDFDRELTVYGGWTNGAYFAARTNSLVTFAGLAPAFLGGSNPFYNLVSTNAGKTLTFQAGATTMVEGELILRKVTLQSSVPGQQWELALLPGAAQEVFSVTVDDSDASGGETIVNLKATSGMDQGNNLNWDFEYYDGTILLIH